MSKNKSCFTCTYTKGCSDFKTEVLEQDPKKSFTFSCAKFSGISEQELDIRTLAFEELGPMAIYGLAEARLKKEVVVSITAEELAGMSRLKMRRAASKLGLSMKDTNTLAAEKIRDYILKSQGSNGTAPAEEAPAEEAPAQKLQDSTPDTSPAENTDVDAVGLVLDELGKRIFKALGEIDRKIEILADAVQDIGRATIDPEYELSGQMSFSKTHTNDSKLGYIAEEVGNSQESD